MEKQELPTKKNQKLKNVKKNFKNFEKEDYNNWFDSFDWARKYFFVHNSQCYGKYYDLLKINMINRNYTEY